MSSFTSITPILISSRKFPQDPVELESTLTKMYTEISAAVNGKTNGLYEATQVTTGDTYFSTGEQTNQKQSFRKVFTFGAIAAGSSVSINHDLTNVTSYVKIYGTCNTDVPDARPIPYTSVTNVNEQIQINITPTVGTTSGQIIILNGAGADNITDGMITIEYLYS